MTLPHSRRPKAPHPHGTEAGQPSSLWRKPPFTSASNDYWLALAASDLSGNAKSAMLVILTKTVGHPGSRRGDYGRDDAVLSARKIAEGMRCSRKTAQDALRELIEAGWVEVVERGRGRKGHTLRPAPQPPSKKRLTLAPDPPSDALPEQPQPSTLEVEEGAAMAREWLAERKARDEREAIKRALGGRP